MSEAAVSLREVTASYGPVRAVDRLSLDANAGTITALLGANGAGKTSTLRIIAGLLIPSAGDVLLDGQDAAGSRGGVIRPRIALSPEGRRLFGGMSVRDNLLVGAFSTRDRRLRRRQLEHVFELLPLLDERQQERAGALSGGQQTMVAIGRALMRMPDVLLLDEPTLGLSPLATGEICQIIRSISQQGTTIILVEQNAAVALSLAEYAYVLEGGRVTLKGTSEQLRDDQGLAASYLGSARAHV